MNLQIMALEKAMENALKESPLPSEVKRLILSELAAKMERETREDLVKQSREVKGQDAESVH